MDPLVITVFVCVYVGMMLGGLPGLAIDRTGVALLGAIALIALRRLTPEQAWQAIDVPTLALLLGLMVVSAQFRLCGAYSALTHRIAGADASPSRLLGLVILAAAGLSAVLANDVVCLAMSPLLVEGCARRGLRPLPFLLGLACASNVGSAATLIGNPQNMLIAQRLHMSFAGYLLDGVAPALLGCAVIQGVIVWRVGGCRDGERDGWRAAPRSIQAASPRFDHWQCAKGVVVIVALAAAFLLTDWPRDMVALAAAGVLLMSRRMHTRDTLSLVDWPLLVLFSGLFIVNDAVARGGALESGMRVMRDAGLDLSRPGWLFGVTAVLSNLVSNVPAVMLLLPAAKHPQAGAILALSSTLAGNLLIVGSIANIIVVDQAGRLGERIGWREHARVGIPVTLATLAIAAAWLWARAMWVAL
jgi:Na+/H+ antiporter NhaD/arsenite permease-like protein